MKKLVSAVLSMALCLAPMTTALMNTTAAGEEDTSVFTVGSYVGAANDTTAEKPAFSAEKFFVVVGTYGGSTQLKYMYPDGSNGYESDKVVLSKNYEEYSYGDILVADGELKMERVDSAPGDPIYRMAYHYTLSDESVLKKAGTCNELMEKKALTVTSTNYDGSAHWSINLADEDGNEYYYGFNAFGSSLGVDPTDGEAGDTYIYVFNDGKLVIPLEKAENDETDTTPPSASPEIRFEDELTIKAGETKEFKYTYSGTDKISFEEQEYGTGLIISNEYENGKGVLTVTAREWASNEHKFWCYLGDLIEDENGNLHREGLYLLDLNVLFHCPDCGRYVTEDEVVHGPMRSICKYCYDEGGYVGTTTGTSTTITTTTTTDKEISDLGSDLGENLSWKLKGDVLVIYGTGEMNDFWFGSLFSDLQFSEVVLPDGLTRIGANAFANSDLPIDTPNGLRKVNIPDSVTSIGDWAFWGCKDLTEVTIPESVTTMGKDVFSNCPDLTIKGAAGSYAESYAKEYDIPFEAISGTTDSTTTTTTSATTAAAATTTTSEAADTPKHIASDETFIQWAVNDYHEKTGAKNVSARIVSADDEKYQINIMDENDNVLDTYTIDPVSGTGTNSADENVDLPQTGMSGAHKMIAGMAALMTLTGAALIKKSRKEDEE